MREMDSSGIYWIRNKLNNKIYNRGWRGEIL